MRITEFCNEVPELTIAMSITMIYGHVKPKRIIIRPIKINKLGRTMYITTENNSCYDVAHIKQIIEVNRP